jgi:rod shape-determining protein MreB
MEKPIQQIVMEVKTAIEETPPELIADIMTNGIYLSGGGALLRGLANLIQKETKIPTKIIEDPSQQLSEGREQF